MFSSGEHVLTTGGKKFQFSSLNILRDRDFLRNTWYILVNLTSALDLYKNETVAKLEMLDLRITNLTEQIYTNDVIIRKV